MKRIQPITRMPELALNTTTDVYLTLVVNFLNVFIEFFTNKNPQNPISLVPGDEPEPEA